jgi:cytochrome c oxidase subunit II
MRRGGMVIGVLVGVLALAVAGCGGGSDDNAGSASAATAAPQTTSAPSTTAAAAAGGGGEDEVQLVTTDFKFDKTSLKAKAGSQVKVELRNQGKAEHNFTFTEGDADQDVEAGEDATVSFTAPAAGSYGFHCKYHPATMKGTITVT